jgi:hypothetical protein
MNNFAKDYLINFKGDLVRLKKGMSKHDVIAIIGEPLRIENCKSKLNEKLIFKVNNSQTISILYSVLFIEEELVYAAKLN